MADTAVSVILPAFNEAAAVAQVVASLREAFGPRPCEILVVDDGSTDGTAEAAGKAGARVVRHPVNAGYGRALLSGAEAAAHEWLLFIDADGSYRPDDAAGLTAHAEGCHMVVGARQGSLFWGSPGKAMLRWLYLRLASFIAGVRIPDANSGLRLVRRDTLLERLPVRCYGFSLSTTMTLSFIQQGLFVKFVPVAYDARVGSSKVRLVRDTLRTLQLMLQIALYFNPLKLTVVAAALCAASAAAAALLGCRWAATSLAAGSAAVFLTGWVVEAVRLQARRDPAARI